MRTFQTACKHALAEEKDVFESADSCYTSVCNCLVTEKSRGHLSPSFLLGEADDISSNTSSHTSSDLPCCLRITAAPAFTSSPHHLLLSLLLPCQAPFSTRYNLLLSPPHLLFLFHLHSPFLSSILSHQLQILPFFWKVCAFFMQLLCPSFV